MQKNTPIRFRPQVTAEKQAPWRKYLKFIIAAQLFTSVGFQFAGPFLPLFIQELGGFDRREAALWAGVAASMNGLVMIFISPIWGTLSDWFGHKRNALRASFATSGIMALTSVLQSIPQLLVCRAIMGAVSGVFPAMLGLAGSIVPKERLAYSIGFLQAVSSLAGTFAPLLGGLFVGFTSYRAAFIVGGGLIGLGGVLVLTQVHEDFHPDVSARHGIWEIGKELRHLIKIPGVPRALIMLFFVQLAPNLVFPVFPLLLTAIAPQEGVVAVGVVFTLMGAASGVAAYATALLSARLGLRTPFFIGCAAGAVGAFFIALATSAVAIAGLSLLLGLATGLLVTSSSTLVGTIAPANRQGSVFGLVQSANSLGFGFGPLIGGIIAHLVGLHAPFLAEAAIFLVIALLALRMTRDSSRAIQPEP